MGTKFAVAIIVLSSLLCGCLVSGDASERRHQLREEAQQCRLDRISSRPPSNRIESEGGIIELWDDSEEEFQCAGVSAVRNIIRPNSLSLPKYHSSPMLFYVEQGEGVLGLNYPGCPEIYEAQSGEFSTTPTKRRGRGVRGVRDQHQKVHRIRRGHIVAVSAGTVEWLHNDGNRDLIVVAFMDLNNDANQLDYQIRSFYMAGGASREGKHEGRGSDYLANIFNGFDAELLAEAYQVPRELVKKMQEGSKGLIVKCNEDMSFLRPDEQEEELSSKGSSRNGVEETICTHRIMYDMNTHKEADLYSREAGRVNSVNQHKLPLLRFLGISAEKGHLFPNAGYNLHWSMTDHRLVYVVEGEAEVQIADDKGNQVFNERVSRGNIFVIPQFYSSLARAGSKGFEWITFKTSSQPRKSPVVGYTSVLRGLPQQVLEQAFQISAREAQDLKQARRQNTFLLPPSSGSRK